MDGQRHLDAPGTGPHDGHAHGTASGRRGQRVDPRAERDRPAHGPDRHRMLSYTREVEAGRPRAHVERQDVEGEVRAARVHDAPADVDPLGRGLEDPYSAARGERGEVDRQVRLGVPALEEAWHHAGVVVPRRRRHQRDLGAGQRPGGEIGQDVEVRVPAPDQDELPHGRGRARRPGLPGSALLRTAPAAGARRTTPAGSGTARAGVAGVRSARARGPRRGIARIEPSA